MCLSAIRVVNPKQFCVFEESRQNYFKRKERARERERERCAQKEGLSIPPLLRLLLCVTKRRKM